MTLDITDLTPRIGAEVKTDLETLLSGSHASQLRALLEQREVLIFRGIAVEDRQQRAIAETLGEVLNQGENGLMKVTFDLKQNPQYAAFFPGTFYWHADGTYENYPPRATMLSPRVLSPTGGQTEFCNTYAAYDDLPEDEKQQLDKLWVIHSMHKALGDAIPNPAPEQEALWRRYPIRIHPLVWQHKTGRKSLFLSTSAAQVVDMSMDDSDALLKKLMAWATRPEYVYHHQWQMGDILVWDNTGTMHRVLPFDLDCGRRLHRYALVGEEPITAVQPSAAGSSH
jgi:alpha-ketoglutarate-dependent taurine dioxygenase